MNMTPNFHRRIRIEGKPDEVRGYMLTVSDAETGEQITNVKSAIVYLSATEVNQAQLTYYDMDADDKHVRHDREPVIRTIVVSDPEIDITAYERLS